MTKEKLSIVSLWLWVVCGLIVLMVAVGGITRLTESGLSMVDWRPVTGILPPLNEAEWDAEFAKYKESPQFEQFNAQEPMKLKDFKKIFFWEYVHRVLGRLVGLAYAVPLFVFMVQRRVKGRLLRHLLLALLVGLGQGFMGWYMVKSGLVDKPYVSHFRLAAHLGLALFLFSYLYWIRLSLHPFDTHRKTNYESVTGLRRASYVFLLLLSLQIAYGAFVAGLDAGRMYPEYPMMGGDFYPADGWSDRWEPAIMNLISNPAGVQFVHRHLGLVVLIYAVSLWWKSVRMRLMDPQRNAFNLTFCAVVIQFILGLMTLVLHMPIGLAVMHQVTACVLLAGTISICHSLRKPKSLRELLD